MPLQTRKPETEEQEEGAGGFPPPAGDQCQAAGDQAGELRHVRQEFIDCETWTFMCREEG